MRPSGELGTDSISDGPLILRGIAGEDLSLQLIPSGTREIPESTGIMRSERSLFCFVAVLSGADS